MRLRISNVNSTSIFDSVLLEMPKRRRELVDALYKECVSGHGAGKTITFSSYTLYELEEVLAAVLNSSG